MENKRKEPSICIDIASYDVAPPITPIKSPNTRTKFRKTEKLVTTKQRFKPKVMIHSSSTRRRVLYFGSGGRIERKLMKIRTTRGHCLTRHVNKYVMFDKKEEEQRLKNEQELFKQRAFSFIASISVVQGDYMPGNRPFMGWKGSVVDSVIGVFLTQNVADSLSSSAFMSLAAKYPNKINTVNENRTQDTIDWNAVRSAETSEVASAIQGRGMNKRLAKRIQDFLDKIYDDKSGLLDLEWLRSAKPEEAVKYFMEVYGLGSKSTDCLRLLTLRQCAFPVDRHVSRIVVRLGWVPIEELPDGVLMHELEDYPVINRVQEYLSKRLSNIDIDTLYELHYQMITFGKVFCTKQKPNCISCPLKEECKHFSSATTSCSSPPGEDTFVPVTPSRSKRKTITAPSIASSEIEDIGDIFLGSQVASRLKTKHRIYELHDALPLVQELDKRDPDDKIPYLLVIWPQGEKAKNPSVAVEEASCSQEEETVFGTLLIPCRTATRGSFPLDGTYFQINEVFAHDESSQKPFLVPRKLLSNLTTKTLYCGTSIASIFEGMSAKEVQECFWNGYVCIRGFNMSTRTPKPLHERLHRGVTKPVKDSIKGKSQRKRTRNNRSNL